MKKEWRSLVALFLLCLVLFVPLLVLSHRSGGAGANSASPRLLLQALLYLLYAGSTIITLLAVGAMFVCMRSMMDDVMSSQSPPNKNSNEKDEK